MIIPVYKPLGASTHQLAKKAGLVYGEPATHTGTLDPMAEGVIVVLTGQDRFNKAQHSQDKKAYEFRMLIGAKTDSHDLLGLTASQPRKNISHDELAQNVEYLLPQFLGKQQQQLPDFSAKRLAGQSYFDAAKRGEQLPPFSEEIEIFELNLIKTETISTNSLQEELSRRINLVEGDFRQSEILHNWQAFLQTSGEQDWPLLTLSALTSKRTYIRGLIRDLSAQLELPATAFSIIRTANGPHTIADCICLL